MISDRGGTEQSPSVVSGCYSWVMAGMFGMSESRYPD